MQEWRKSNTQLNNAVVDRFCIITLLQALIVKFSLCWIRTNIFKSENVHAGNLLCVRVRKQESLQSEMLRLFAGNWSVTNCFWFFSLSAGNSKKYGLLKGENFGIKECAFKRCVETFQKYTKSFGGKKVCAFKWSLEICQK